MSMPPEDRTASDEELDQKDPQRKVRRMKGRELRLIQEQRLIIDQDIDVGYPDGYSLDGIKEWNSFWNADWENI
jgi:pyridoxine kinase